MKRAGPYILLLALAVAITLIKKCKNGQQPEPKTKTQKETTTNTDRERGFDRRISYLEYSEHAMCRMQCRQISKSEVEDMMKTGNINYSKSDLQNSRCPRYAVEGITADNQKVRIVFAQCNEKTEVVTVIDLDTDWTCHCPGDDKKYENRN
ncbi:MAG: DUF4258 domain-containing protein [Chitinophagaceae bacterium]|nr:MAG: DUF4258 domain-containing protein [Chitinophagaceae bacterium]